MPKINEENVGVVAEIPIDGLGDQKRPVTVREINEKIRKIADQQWGNACA